MHRPVYRRDACERVDVFHLRNTVTATESDESLPQAALDRPAALQPGFVGAVSTHAQQSSVVCRSHSVRCRE